MVMGADWWILGSKKSFAGHSRIIYQKETPEGVRVVNVKNGFCWPAFFFWVFWAWAKGLVGIGFGILFGALVLNFVGTFFQIYIGPAGGLVPLPLAILFAAWVGSNGNAWVRNSLEKSGYKLMNKITEAEDAQIRAANQAGQIGFQSDGYLGFVRADLPDGLKELVEKTNSWWKDEYQNIAGKRRTDLGTIEKRAGSKRIEGAAIGTFVKKEGSDWEIKKG